MLTQVRRRRVCDLIRRVRVLMWLQVLALPALSEKRFHGIVCKFDLSKSKSWARLLGGA